MIRSGIEATLSAVRYSGCCWNKELFSRVLASSDQDKSVHSGYSLMTCARRRTVVSLLELGLGGDVGHFGVVRVVWVCDGALRVGDLSVCKTTRRFLASD